MNITCPHCQAKLNLPDDKIPRDRDTSFKCPKCRESVHIKAGQPAEAAPSPAGAPPAGAAASHQADVLVCMADTGAKARIAGAVARSGWTAETAASPEQALQRLEYEIYPLLIMDDRFDDQGAMAAHLNELDMSLRRRICLVLISRDAKTGDAMTALHTSSNFVINAGDAAGGDDAFIGSLLASARTDHDNFYRVYNDSMRAVGKA